MLAVKLLKGKQYQADQGIVEKEVNYILLRYILAFTVSLIEVAMNVGIVAILCYYVPYFYLAAWCTEITLIGTINLDYNSLVHHFENGV